MVQVWGGDVRMGDRAAVEELPGPVVAVDDAADLPAGPDDPTQGVGRGARPDPGEGPGVMASRSTQMLGGWSS
jgi:hypothetical protein